MIVHKTHRPSCASIFQELPDEGLFTYHIYIDESSRHILHLSPPRFKERRKIHEQIGGVVSIWEILFVVLSTEAL